MGGHLAIQNNLRPSNHSPIHPFFTCPDLLDSHISQTSEISLEVLLSYTLTPAAFLDLLARMASLEGKVFALTGAASGIGLSTARVLAARGASLSLSDVNKAGLEAAVASLSNGQHQGKFAAFHTDVADRSSVRDFVQNTLKQFGKLDGCANIAGVAGKDLGVNSLWESDSADFDFVMAVNAKGVFNCLTEELQPSVLQEGGSIVNIASIAGLRAMPKSASYCASKHAVIGLTRCAADDAGPRGIRVNAVAP